MHLKTFWAFKIYQESENLESQDPEKGESQKSWSDIWGNSSLKRIDCQFQNQCLWDQEVEKFSVVL